MRLNNPGVLDLARKGPIAYVELGNPGVPHGVMEYHGDLWADAEKLWEQFRQLRHDPAFPKGANMNMYQWVGPQEVRILTFERGVEDYTLACGTGTGSVAVTLWCQGKLPEGKLTVYNQGGTLAVTITGQEGRVQTLDLEGPTEIVRVHELEID